MLTKIHHGSKNSVLKLLSGILLLFVQFSALAQDDAEMADVMRAEGKIYVVVAVVSIILTGILLYQVHTSRKIKKLEKLISEKEQEN